MSNKTKVRKLELKRKPYGFGNWYIILDKGYSGRWNIDHNPEQQRIIHQDLRSFLKDTAIKKWKITKITDEFGKKRYDKVILEDDWDLALFKFSKPDLIFKIYQIVIKKAA